MAFPLFPVVGVTLSGLGLYFTIRRNRIPPAVAQAAVNAPASAPAPLLTLNAPTNADVAAALALARANLPTLPFP